MPRHWLPAIAYALAYLSFKVFRFRKRLIIENLTKAFGTEMSPDEFEQIGLNSVYSFILTIFEFLSVRDGSLYKGVEFSNPEVLKEALAQKKGVFILCIHMGNWEAMGSAVSHSFADAFVPVKKVGKGSMDRLASELRDKNHFFSITRKKKGDGFIKIKNALKAGKVVGFVIDQARPGEPRLPFFGHPAKTNTSLAAIWRKQPAPVVPGIILRNEFGRHTVTFFEPMKLQVTDEPKEDVLENTKKFNAIAEKMIREMPDQYFWMHNRWK